ncbi:LutC/YkgG family protein [Aridibaculum aurantiacum]|uniref:LutC/YkgG family protein n=1 Tax=Aridibaculum aurantiacum TaxID=2810307 RepID=UPI001A957FBB|nr:LUD domain-containing protein [Aridibaculum aurantiacum]
MSSRQQILAAIKAARPEPTPLPAMDFAGDKNGMLEEYITTLTGIGGNCIVAEDLQVVNDHIADQLAAGKQVVQTIDTLAAYNAEAFKDATALALETVDTAYVKGELAVAENGAVYVPEKNMLHRVLPFICQHLVFVVNEKQLVPTMHEAYATNIMNGDDYGVFIAGPSKTADIEQSLVIGAHGPLNLTVFMVQDNKGS